MNEIIVSADEQTFNEEVLKSDKLVLVEFWTTWCSTCKMLLPIISCIKNKYNNKLKIVKVNVDENIDIVLEYEVMSVPTVLAFKKGKKVASITGVRSKKIFEEMVKKYI